MVTNLRISLLEALLGFEREIKHLDGHLVQVSVPRGVVVQPDEVLVIEGEGMPLDPIQGNLPVATVQRSVMMQCAFEYLSIVSCAVLSLVVVLVQ